jgi:uncharacterized protein YegJ (DUF2314 family)
MRFARYTVTLALASTCALAQLAPNAPKDRPVDLTPDQISNNDRAIAPFIAAARSTYPEARARFLHGLPAGQHFFVVTRIHDSHGHWEQVFIRVQSVRESTISGIISSQMRTVTEFKLGDRYELQESDLMDWVISKPDGSEEGNLIGKFLDSHGQ